MGNFYLRTRCDVAPAAAAEISDPEGEERRSTGGRRGQVGHERFPTCWLNQGRSCLLPPRSLPDRC